MGLNLLNVLHILPSQLIGHYGKILGNQLILKTSKGKKERSIYPALLYCNMGNQIAVEGKFLFIKIF